MNETAQELLAFLLGISILMIGLISSIFYFSNESDKINMPFKTLCLEKGMIYDKPDCTTLISTKKN